MELLPALDGGGTDLAPGTARQSFHTSQGKPGARLPAQLTMPQLWNNAWQGADCSRWQTSNGVLRNGLGSLRGCYPHITGFLERNWEFIHIL